MLPDWFNQLGLMQWPLATCAIVALAICIERSVFFIQLYTHQAEQFQALLAVLEAHQQHSKAMRDEVVAVLLNELQPKYNQGIKLLRMIAMMAPMLGLLGTILGIIEAFKIIAAQTAPVTANLIADGLWEAMLTTAAGLLIALPILFLAYCFQYLADKQLSHFCLRLNKRSMEIALAHASLKNDNHPQPLQGQAA